MFRAPIIAIVLGAMVFDLDLLPGFLGTLLEGLQNFPDHPPPSRRLVLHIQTDMRRYGDIRLVLGGGVIMILGLLVACNVLIGRPSSGRYFKALTRSPKS